MAALLLKSFLIFGILLGATLADFCPGVTVIKTLDLKKLGGTWWVWDYSGMISYTEPHRCHVSHFYPMPDGKSISVINDYIYWTDKPNHVRYPWTITDEDPAPGGKLVNTMKITRMGEKQVPFFVLDTDYDRYLVVHMCKDGFHPISRMKSTLTLLRNTTFTEQQLKDIGSKVESALEQSRTSRNDLGLFHDDESTAGCVLPNFPIGVQTGKSAVIDTEALTATVNGLAAHGSHAVDDAISLVKDAADPATKPDVLIARLKEHADDVKAIVADIKKLSSL